MLKSHDNLLQIRTWYLTTVVVTAKLVLAIVAGSMLVLVAAPAAMVVLAVSITLVLTF